MTTRFRFGRTAVAVIAATACAAPAAATTFTKVALLNGGQAGTASGATGCARFTLDTTADTLSYRIVYSGLTGAETVAHLHGPAGPGVNAGIVHPLPAGSPKVGTWNYPAALEADIIAGNIYINIHTTTSPGGEIRGQVVDMVAEINAPQEVPPNASLATGYGLFNIDTCANRLSYHIDFGGLGGAETAAHIHGYALHTMNAGPVHTLPLGTPKVGAWSYPEADEEAILAGRTYVNIHSAVFPGGEIRGQVVPIAAPLDGFQEVPAVTFAGTGCAQVAWDPGTDRLSYFVTHRDLSGPATAAHIHGFAPAGANAGVQLNIGPATPNIGVWSYGAANAAAVLGDLTYVNVHTAAAPSGEVRGQIEFPAPPCAADLDCNGTVGFADLNLVLSAWGPCPGCPEDIDGNGSVGFADLNIVLAAWGPCP